MTSVLKDISYISSPSFSLYTYIYIYIYKYIAVKCFGVATSYLIVFGDLMPQVMMQVGIETYAVF